MKTKIWKSGTVPYSIWSTFIFVLVTFTALDHPFIQYMYMYYFVLTLLTIVKVEFEAVPVVNEQLRFFNNLKEVPLSSVRKEKDYLVASISGKQLIFVDSTSVANYMRIHLYFSKVLDKTQTSSRYIIVHEWHLWGYIDQYNVYEKTPVIHPEDK